MVRFTERWVHSMVFAVLAAFPEAALAEMPVTYQDGGKALFHLDTPDYWTARAGGPRLIAPPGSDELRATNRIIGFQPTAQDTAWVGFISPRGVRNLDEARVYLREIGSFLLTDPVVESGRQARIGGRPSLIFKGTGRRGGRSVGFTALAIDLPQNRVAIGIAVLEPGVDPAVVEATNRLIASFRTAR